VEEGVRGAGSFTRFRGERGYLPTAVEREKAMEVRGGAAAAHAPSGYGLQRLKVDRYHLQKAKQKEFVEG
jgi:hypothetical protein